jgi:hypothetical protein
LKNRRCQKYQPGAGKRRQDASSPNIPTFHGYISVEKNPSIVKGATGAFIRCWPHRVKANVAQMSFWANGGNFARARGSRRCAAFAELVDYGYSSRSGDCAAFVSLTSFSYPPIVSTNAQNPAENESWEKSRVNDLCIAYLFCGSKVNLALSLLA